MIHTEPPGRGARVRMSGLCKAYGARQVLQSIDLDIAPGEFVAVIGRSGCGKSTLLRLLAGLEGAQQGTLLVQPAARAVPSEGRSTRIVFQDARLLPWKRVLDNVCLGSIGREQALDALAQVGLADRAHEWPAHLSGGQRQRVALARALVHRPELLLLDEPLGALDALTRLEMQRLIEKLWRQCGFTAVLVTHDVQEAVALAGRIVLIEDGRMALDQHVDLPRPRPRAAAGFAQLEGRILERVLEPA